MIRILDTTYPGAVLKNTDDLIGVCIMATNDKYGAITASLKDARSVDELNDQEEVIQHYAVVGPLNASIIAENLFYIEFSMKPSLVKQLEATLQELSDTVDQLLIDSLEG